MQRQPSHVQLSIVVAGAASFALVSANRRCTCRAVNVQTLCAVVTARKPPFVAVVRTMAIDDFARSDVYRLSNNDLIKEINQSINQYICDCCSACKRM